MPDPASDPRSDALSRPDAEGLTDGADYPPAHAIRRRGEWTTAVDEVLLDHDARFLRRKRLVTSGGGAFLADLGATVSLDDGDAFELSDGRLIAVVAAEEPLYEIHGDLVRLAWHIGNRHTPCAIEPGRLLIRRDPVLAGMVAGLGGHVHEILGPFTPEGGAYGPGRTMGHAHDHSDAEHRHVHHHATSGYAGDVPDPPEAP